MEDGSVNLRMSSLPTFNDCARRAAFRQFAPIIKEVTGIEAPPSKSSRAARIGHALHKKIELLLTAKMDPEFYDEELVKLATRNVLLTGPDKRQETDNDEPAFDDLPEDEDIPDAETAEKILANMDDAVTELVQQIEPAAMEASISALIEGLNCTGHPDILTTDKAIVDNKSHKGTEPKNYIGQFGGYGAILLEQGEEVRALKQQNFQRLKTKQSPLRTTEYDVDAAVRHARNTIGRTANNLETFIDTGNPESFNANPQSPLCSKKWCDAWGTPWCNVHKQGG